MNRFCNSVISDITFCYDGRWSKDKNPVSRLFPLTPLALRVDDGNFYDGKLFLSGRKLRKMLHQIHRPICEVILIIHTPYS